MKPYQIDLKMKSLCGYFVNTSCHDNYQHSNSENFSPELNDPLHELGNEVTKPKCYKMDSVVFAEPLKVTPNAGNSSKDTAEELIDEEEMMFIDNVIVQKTTGKKYKKYHIHFEDATNPRCSQPNCTRIFSSTKLLKAHIRKVHCADRNKYICETCGTGFSAQYLLVRHTGVHASEKIECPVCSKPLSVRTSLSRHLRSHSTIKNRRRKKTAEDPQ